MSAFRMVGVGGIEGKTVTGAPYSADESTQTTQTLADGNRIVNASKSRVYRDQQGRKRVEQSMGNIGGLAAVEAHTTITINDPVANVHYTLHPDSRTAEKVETNSNVSAQYGVTVAKLQAELTERAKLMQADAMAQAQQMEGSSVRMRAPEAGIEGSATTMVYKMAAEESARTEENLGTQNMEGVQVQGKRTTTTIPAGAMGNERPIQIVDERWYSPELQMNIMTKHSDPRMGETVFTVTNVSRANPDVSLFQLPSDYQVNNSMLKRVYKLTKDSVR